MNGPALAAALAQLTNLQALRISADYHPTPAGMLSGVAHLTQLAALTISASMGDRMTEELQQVLQQPVPLKQLRLSSFSHTASFGSVQYRPKLNLSGLASLEELVLDLGITSGLDPGSILPPNLRRLCLGRCQAGHMAGLQLQLQLQKLTLLVDMDQRGALLPLAQLPQLEQLCLVYRRAGCAAATCSAWSRLPQLHELELKWHSDPTTARFDSTMEALASASSLTRLQLEVLLDIEDDSDDDSDDEDAQPELNVEVCRHIGALTQLKVRTPQPPNGKCMYDSMLDV